MKNGTSYIDESVVKQFEMLGTVQVFIYILLLGLMIYIIMRIFGAGSVFKGKGIKNTISYEESVRKKDERDLSYRNFINAITRKIEKTPLSLNNAYKDYWEYNLRRANIQIPGGSRVIKPEEFNAIVVSISTMLVLIGLVVTILINSIAGIISIVFVIVMSNTIPMTIVRQTVKEKDAEIQDNFTDLYLTLHHVMLTHGETPISKLLEDYLKITTSLEMERFVKSSLESINTYGELMATSKISKEFREIPQVGKLMRLIAQSNEGGDVDGELIGFRQELLNNQEYLRGKRMDKTVKKAQASFNILMIILVQAILSAMSIYLKDISMAGSLFGK